MSWAEHDKSRTFKSDSTKKRMKKGPNNFNRMQLASWMPFPSPTELLALSVCLCKDHGNNSVQSGLEVVLMGT